MSENENKKDKNICLKDNIKKYRSKVMRRKIWKLLFKKIIKR